MTGAPFPLLAFDTSAAHCAAALVTPRGLFQRYEQMQKGQAERLMPLLEDLLDEAAISWPQLAALAVGIGPGNFTGVRIAVAAARGLALGLRLPLAGISTFELMRDPASPEAHSAELVSLAAPRGEAFVQPFRFGDAQAAPMLIDPANPPAWLAMPGRMRITGHRADEIAPRFAAEAAPGELADIPARLIRVASWKFATGRQSLTAGVNRPAPLYAKPPDAAPPSDPPPVILDAPPDQSPDQSPDRTPPSDERHPDKRNEA
ncbi:tRNA (adenosine(37)-N6)-threonylcarbamoyltransferase complex dimerization subunit type 1 TsaB [Xinfangfangia sp. D13-10-4-6]|uniref:tRNA (adenosine(37)-N6)-threonylcarbamoyltransferase complex dimerization subunit type 1 TsaB n=1 Tax=Pseudogemmobacter hezensis TaxID=2737662 RepID=UPI0015576FA4|nr:tRNA (adenosine(37)-N6)-threonylcarbamoyltransferase complex dimerization subunit type 1 TsaB [Pseudogemmobacter hezensis]NPD17112.1 tRNA (adenosine(37)-N6)-threonylcarbamoyltransferase complex dimerization subunit type 1 TsaB [Pseudogemmobacter hezensis]